MNFFNKKIFFLVLILFGVGFYTYKWFAPSREKTQEQTIVISRGDLLQRVTIAGNIEALKTTLVTAPYDGYVQKIFVKIGDKVKSGDPLVSVSQTLQVTENVYPIRAPFPGTIVQVLRTEGEFIKQGDTNNYILRLDDMSKLFVQADVPEIDIVKIKKGQEAIIKASPILDRSYKGVVREISLASNQQASANNRSQAEYRVKLEVTAFDELLKPGMSTILDIIPDKRMDVLVLPHEYINKNDKGDYTVTMKDGSVRKIEIGLQNETMVEVTGGLKEGEVVRQIDFIGLGKDLNGVPSGRRKRH
ncbi:MAG: efflux RND transporter periplasmic adaptor subunit [Bdellovibrionaceae bacterium]|nr:efflux RND transporter periplasmic adaptor subunit [Pseudobdellovibrionaceae bacterium]